jgi:LPS sulfotransferase NodH
MQYFTHPATFSAMTLIRLRKQAFELAAALGLAGQRDYRRFIILGRGRSGSNFLATSLASHPAIVTFGELFNNLSYPDGGINWSYPGYANADQAASRLRLAEPLRFIDEKVFAPMPSAVRAVGFKLFYFHAREPEWAPVWEHLRETKVAAVHLRRRNLLASLVSAEVAKRTKQWSTLTAGPRPTKVAPIDLDPGECRTYFEKTEAHRRNFSGLFPDRIDLDYEDLVADYEGTTNRVQDFLGVPRAKLSSELRKQASTPLDRRIANYEMLAQHFRGSPWEALFEDPSAY